MHASQTLLGEALLDLLAFTSDPRRDRRLLEAAGLELDPALLPLLLRLSREAPAPVVDLAAAVGRDPSTVSRQVARLEQFGLARRAGAADDRRVRAAELTPQGRAAVAALASAREQLLAIALRDWSKADRRTLALLVARFAASLTGARPPG